MRASFQPTALPLRALSQSPGSQAHSDRNVALSALFRLESAHRPLVGTSGASLAPSPAFGKAPGRIIISVYTALRIMLARAGELPRPTPRILLSGSCSQCAPLGWPPTFLPILHWQGTQPVS